MLFDDSTHKEVFGRGRYESDEPEEPEVTTEIIPDDEFNKLENVDQWRKVIAIIDELKEENNNSNDDRKEARRAELDNLRKAASKSYNSKQADVYAAVKKLRDEIKSPPSDDAPVIEEPPAPPVAEEKPKQPKRTAVSQGAAKQKLAEALSSDDPTTQVKVMLQKAITKGFAPDKLAKKDQKDYADLKPIDNPSEVKVCFDAVVRMAKELEDIARQNDPDEWKKFLRTYNALADTYNKAAKQSETGTIDLKAAKDIIGAYWALATYGPRFRNHQDKAKEIIDQCTKKLASFLRFDDDEKPQYSRISDDAPIIDRVQYARKSPSKWLNGVEYPWSATKKGDSSKPRPKFVKKAQILSLSDCTFHDSSVQYLLKS